MIPNLRNVNFVNVFSSCIYIFNKDHAGLIAPVWCMWNLDPCITSKPESQQRIFVFFYFFVLHISQGKGKLLPCLCMALFQFIHKTSILCSGWDVVNEMLIWHFYCTFALWVFMHKATHLWNPNLPWLPCSPVYIQPEKTQVHCTNHLYSYVAISFCVIFA